MSVRPPARGSEPAVRLQRRRQARAAQPHAVPRPRLRERTRPARHRASTDAGARALRRASRAAGARVALSAPLAPLALPPRHELPRTLTGQRQLEPVAAEPLSLVVAHARARRVGGLARGCDGGKGGGSGSNVQGVLEPHGRMFALYQSWTNCKLRIASPEWRGFPASIHVNLSKRVCDIRSSPL